MSGLAKIPGCKVREELLMGLLLRLAFIALVLYVIYLIYKIVFQGDLLVTLAAFILIILAVIVFKLDERSRRF